MVGRLGGRRILVVGFAVVGLVGAFVGGAYGSHTFIDVASNSFYHDDVSWLVANKITAGCGGGKYCPNNAVTRGQMATFLHNFAGVRRTLTTGCDEMGFVPLAGGAYNSTANGRAALAGHMGCGVQLPNGAVVTALTARFWDGHPTTNASCGLAKRALLSNDPTTGTNIVSTNSTSGTPGITTVTGATSFAAPVDNANNTYFLTCGLTVDDVDGKVGIYGAIVEYTVETVPAP